MVAAAFPQVAHTTRGKFPILEAEKKEVGNKTLLKNSGMTQFSLFLLFLIIGCAQKYSQLVTEYLVLLVLSFANSTPVNKQKITWKAIH